VRNNLRGLGVVRFFFLVSGENPTLPFAEIEAILESEGHAYSILFKLSQVLVLESDPKCVESIAHRSALTRVCGFFIASCRASVQEILDSIRRADISAYISPGESFVVRVRRVRGSSPQIDRLLLERRIGEVIFESVKGVKVNLKNPEKIFFGVLSDDNFVFGLKTAEIKAGKFRKRSRVAFSHSAAMPPKIARCMVNLARVRSGDLVLDPFCGTGSFLIEAGLIGCRVVGSDIKRRMVEGSMLNLSACGVKAEGLLVADARSSPYLPRRVDRIVTDPPYGTSTTTLGMDVADVYRNFLSEAEGILRGGGYICLAAPKRINVSRIAEEIGFKHLESHFMYIHRRLTREIAVFST